MSEISAKWLCTLNNPFDHGVEHPAEFLESFYNKTKATYLNGQVEVGASGTPHI